MTSEHNPDLCKATDTIPGISDHDITLSDMNIKPLIAKKTPCKVHKFSQASWDLIREETVKFADTFTEKAETQSVEENWQDFKDFVEHILDKHVPTKMTSTRYNLPWFNRQLKRMCRCKQRLYNKAWKSRQPHD